jgi:hypothetical protein
MSLSDESENILFSTLPVLVQNTFYTGTVYVISTYSQMRTGTGTGKLYVAFEL